jgi:hypothetical protein
MSAGMLCGSGGFTPLFAASDRLYHTTARLLAAVRRLIPTHRLSWKEAA